MKYLGLQVQVDTRFIKNEYRNHFQFSVLTDRDRQKESRSAKEMIEGQHRG